MVGGEGEAGPGLYARQISGGRPADHPAEKVGILDACDPDQERLAREALHGAEENKLDEVADAECTDTLPEFGMFDPLPASQRRKVLDFDAVQHVGSFATSVRVCCGRLFRQRHGATGTRCCGEARPAARTAATVQTGSFD